MLLQSMGLERSSRLWIKELQHLQGFRKVDPDKWEFANEGFLRGKRNLLKNIHRRKSSQSQQLTSYGGSSSESGIVGEMEKLRKDKSALMQEVVELQQQQRGTAERVEMVKDRLQASEQRQKQMVSFLAKVLQNPAFLDRLKQMKEQRSLGSPKTRRKFLKQKQQDGCSSGTSVDGQMVRHRPEFPNLGDHASSEIPRSSTPDYLLQDVMGKMSSGVESMAFGMEDVSLDEFAAAQEFVAGSSSSGVGDPFSSAQQVASLQPEAGSDYFVSFPEEFAKERTLPEFSSPAIDNILKQEEVWSMGFDLSADISSSGAGLWGNDASYDFPGEFSDILDLGSLQAGSSRVEKWPGADTPLGYPRDRAFESKDDVSKNANS